MRTAPPDIYVRLQGDDNEFVKVPFESLPDNPYDLIYLLKVETAPRSCWRDVAAAYFRGEKWSAGITVLEEATSDDVESMLRGGVDDQPPPKDGFAPRRCSRLELLAALAGAHIMAAGAASNDSAARKESLDRAAHVFSRADKIDLDDPSIWTARGWAEFHAEKHTAINWFENARDKNVVLAAMGLAAIQLNRTKHSDPPKRDTVELLVSVLRSNHCPPGVWTGLAYALFREGRMKAARNIARRAVLALENSGADEKREALYLIALIESVDKNAASVEHMAAALREAYIECEGHKDARILTLIAEMHFNGGDFDGAEQFAQKAVWACDNVSGASVGSMFGGIQNGMKASAFFQLARAQHHLGKLQDAIQGFEQVKKIADEGDGVLTKVNPGVYLRLGLLKLASDKQHDEQMAQECLEKAIKESNDRCGVAKRALGVLLGRRVLIGLKRGRPRGGEHYHKAVNLLKKGLTEDKEAAKDHCAQLVYAGLVEESSPKVALEAYTEAVKALEEKSLPVAPEIWNNVASITARVGDISEASDLFAAKIDSSLANECTTIIYNQARITEMAGHLDRAETIYQSIKQGDPHYFESIARIAVICMDDENRLDQAEAHLKEAMESPQTKHVAAAFLSTLYARQKKFKQAQEILEANRHECDYLALSFSSFMHRFLDSLDHERKQRFLLNHIGTPLINILKRSKHNSFAANGVGVYFAESKMISEARDAFSNAGAGPLAVKTARVNLAHTQVLLAHRAISDSARPTGRASYQVVSNSRALFEQADKLYRDALQASSLKGSKEDFNAYCELMLYMAWTQFEAGEFRSSADMLTKLLHLVPTSPVTWFNLGQALLESASVRVIKGKAVLEEMQQAKDEFEGSRQALMRSLYLDKKHPDPLARIQFSRKLAEHVIKYVRQQAKTHDVNLRNARLHAEDLETKRRESLKLLEAKQQQKKEREQKAEDLRRQKEEELRRVFEESERKKQQYREEHERQLAAAAKEEEGIIDDEEYEDENGEVPQKKPKSKRRKKEPLLEDEKPAKKAKKQRKTPTKKKTIDDSGSEYSDEGGDRPNGTANGTKRPYSDDSDEDEAKEPKRKRFSLAKDEDVSDGDF